MSDWITLENAGFRLRIGLQDGQVMAQLEDLPSGRPLADAAYHYEAAALESDQTIVSRRLREARVERLSDGVRVTGMLAGLALTHDLHVPAGTTVLEERLTLCNDGDRPVNLGTVRTGFRLTLMAGGVDPIQACLTDRFAAVPMRHDGMTPRGTDLDLSLADMMSKRGDEHRLARWQVDCVPDLHWVAEAWAWMQEGNTCLISAFSQEAMTYSVVRVGMDAERGACVLIFGGFDTAGGDRWRLHGIQPGEQRTFGLTRFESVAGGHTEACLAYRCFLDNQGCRFPADWNPPVHWNELFDNPEWSLWQPVDGDFETWNGKPATTRRVTYSREMMETEARKAVAYGCEALYLDPGWDTCFGSFVWGDQWLGPCADFVNDMQARYGLKTAVHLACAPWMSVGRDRQIDAWPAEARRGAADGTVLDSVCMGSRQYLDEATARVLRLCEAGVSYFMFDGNFFMTCHDRNHGHPVPFTIEDHIEANIELTRRIHARFPSVIIEMHNMVTGRQDMRPAPLYYRYGEAGSYDETWGWEMMALPLRFLRNGQALCTYYHALGCNIPVYMHIDLADDTVGCPGLWWYASTCRHLGIGGTHPDPMVAEAQRRAMVTYRRLKPFFTRGEFHAAHEEVHFHVHPDRNALVVNLFNLTDQHRAVRGEISFEQLGLDPALWYSSNASVWYDRPTRRIKTLRHLAPWSAEVVEMQGYAVPANPRMETTPGRSP